MQSCIDVVLTWVDGNDPVWRGEKSDWEKRIKGVDESNNSECRYRDWDNVQYIFRGIEKYMPWVRMVHFVTWGHLPEWMNKECPKLHIVNHKDFIPGEYLPTFNSNAIELNFHRIPGLADQFINFNDDMFVIAPTKPDDFFRDGLPRDMAVLSPPPVFRDIICNIEINNLEVINDHFDMTALKNNKEKWFSLKYGKYLARTMIFSRFKTILGLFESHTPFSHLKSTMEEVWGKEFEVLDQTCKNRFRSRDDVNEWLFRYWQLMSGKFEPRRSDFGLLMKVSDTDRVVDKLRHPGHTRLLCLNDADDVKEFENIKDIINKELERKFPEKSIFEK